MNFNLKSLSIFVFVSLFALSLAGPTLAAETVISETKANIYGFVRTDFIYDEAANHHGEFLSWTDSEERNDDSFHATARFSRLGIDFENDNISAKVEGDFYGNLTGGHSSFRMRHFYVEADQGNYSFLVGQTWHLTPLEFPAINNGLAGGYSGALWHRVTQARLSYALNENLNFAFAVTRPNRDNAIGLNLNEGLESGQPGLEAKTSAKVGGAKFTLSGALGAWEKDDMGTDTGATAKVKLLALGYNVPLGPATLNGQLWTGQNLEDFLGSPGMGYEEDAVEADGGFANLSAPVTEDLTLSTGYGISDPDEDKTDSNEFDKNYTIYGTAAFPIFEEISTKVTYARNVTHATGGGKPENSHFQTSFTYTF